MSDAAEYTRTALDRREAAAKAATPGPWSYNRAKMWLDGCWPRRKGGPVNDISTWEGRMSAKAKARQAITAAEEAARVDAVRMANPPVHPDEDGPMTDGPHAGHYTHWGPAHGSGVMCSCGVTVGCFSIIVSPDDPPAPACDICAARGH